MHQIPAFTIKLPFILAGLSIHFCIIVLIQCKLQYNYNLTTNLKKSYFDCISCMICVYSTFSPAVSGCVDVLIAAGAAAASFVGGVLLTALIASCVAGAVFCKKKRKSTHKLVHM